MKSFKNWGRLMEDEKLNIVEHRIIIYDEEYCIRLTCKFLLLQIINILKSLVSHPGKKNSTY